MAAFTIDAAGLGKDFGTRTAVRDLTLKVGRGEAFGFLGPNGAGKSTSIKMLLGLVKPTRGQALLLGEPVGSRDVRARIGFLPEHFRFYDWLSAAELLMLHGRLCGVSDGALGKRVPRLLERVGLGAQNSKPLRSYSKGMMQRAGLAQALINEPDILFLDEPTSGLDPSGRKLVREIVREQRDRGATVFLNSHLLGEVEQSCDRVAFIREGQVVGEYQMGGWQKERTSAEIEAAGVSPASVALLELIAGVRVDSHVGRRLKVQVEHEDRLAEIVRLLVENGACIYSVIPQRVTLEDQFLEMMGPDQGL
ncbi:MAG TPA: ABC transporter ATP-binding protein [Terracidiphilus sp.]